MVDGVHTINKIIQTNDESRRQVEARGITPPSEEDLKSAQQIQKARGEYILQHYTQEDLSKAKTTLGQEDIFKGEVRKENAEKMDRGENPSFSRLLVDYALIVPAQWQIVTHTRSRYEGVAPVQNKVTHQEQA